MPEPLSGARVAIDQLADAFRLDFPDVEVVVDRAAPEVRIETDDGVFVVRRHGRFPDLYVLAPPDPRSIGWYAGTVGVFERPGAAARNVAYHLGLADQPPQSYDQP